MAHDTGDDGSDESGTDDIGDIERRDYMKAVAAASALGGLGTAATGTAAAETADTSKTVDERIQDHRTGGLEVVVEDSNGNAVADADVSVTQHDHDFGFGTAVNADTLINQTSSGDNYREYIPELFNKAVIENGMKWRFWETDQQLADDAVNWLLDQGLDVRGHVCIWGDESTGSIPSDIQTAIDNRDAQTIRDRSMQHIEDIITHYGDDITEWEIVNEAMHKMDLQVGVYGDQIDQEEPWTGEVVPWTSQLLADWYDKAESVIDTNGLDCGIAVNDFNQFAYSYTDGRYQTEIEHINQNAVQLDTIGLQAHVGARTGEFNTNSSPDGRISASQVAAEINKWADYGASVKITEFDTYNGNDWNSDQERADTLRSYLRGAFSHPGVDDFLMWGFWDGRHWENEAPLFYDDWSQKPGYDVWTNLVYDQWWTDESGTTDSSGTYATNAYLGDHEVTVNGSTTTTVTVTDPSGTATVTVTVDDSGSGGGSTDEQAPYSGTPHAIPGQIPAEEYDEGGSGGAYSDATTENEGGAFRTGEAVDVSSVSGGTGYSVGYIEAGEWIEYTVDVDQAGDYTMAAYVASDSGGGSFHVEVNGQDVSGTVDVPATGGWDTWETVTTSGVSLDAGQQVIRVAMDASWWDLNYLEFSLDGSGGGTSDTEAPTAPSNLSVTGTTRSSASVSWDAASDSGTGVDSYVVSVDGTQDSTVDAGTTSATVDSLSSGTTYTVGVSAVDGAGNESATTTVEATTGSDSSGGGSTDLIAEIDPETTAASVGERVSFQVTDTSDSDTWIDSLSWSLGNGDTASGWYAETSYGSAGSYTVELEATNNEGETTTDTVTVDVS